jgi:Cell division protein FtsI/penicillin-binding protein 2
MKPHLVRDIENPITKDTRPVVRDPSDKIAVKQSDIDIIKRAMEGVVTNGTASKLFIGAPYQAAGKTVRRRSTRCKARTTKATRSPNICATTRSSSPSRLPSNRRSRSR